MARGFGSVYGVGDSDRINGSTAMLPDRITFLVRSLRSGGYTTYHRIYGRGSGSADIYVHNPLVANTYGFGNINTNSAYYWTAPQQHVWSCLGISAHTADPDDVLVVQDKDIRTIGNGVTKQAVGSNYSTISTSQAIGNRASDNARNWIGAIGEFAIYNDRLTVGEHMEFQRGVSPNKIRPHNLRVYLPMQSDPKINLGGMYNLWTPTGTKFVDSPVFPHVQPRRQSVFLPSWMSSGGPPSPSPLAVFRNHYINQGIA